MIHLRLALGAALAASALFSTTGCAGAMGARYHEEVHTRVSEAPKTLAVKDPVGRVTIEAWNNPYVQIDAVKRAPSTDALRAITISVVPDGDTLNVAADLGGNSSNRQVTFTIHVPAATNLSVEAATGEVNLSGFTGNVDVNASVGSINVAMAALRRGQHVKIDSSVGSIKLEIPQNADATIDADTSVGSLGGDVPLSVERQTVGASGHGVLGNGAAHVNLTAATGSISINRE